MAPGKMKALGSPDLYTIGWIAALHIERAAAAAMLDEEHAQPEGFSRNPNDRNSYTWGRIGDHNIVIASLKAGVHGLVSAGATASSLLSSLPSIRLGLLVGIGGGIPRPDGGYDIRLGDVIVSQPDGTTGGVCQYDLVKAKPGNRRQRKGFLAPPPDVLLHAVANIQSAHELRDSEIPNFLEEMQTKYPKMAKKTKQSPGYVHQGFANDRLFQPSYEHISSQHEACQSCEVVQEVVRDERESTDPEIHYGIIASGNTLVKDGIARDRIVGEVGEECICFEMEAAGLMNEFPCLVIRGVCDYADSHKNDQWQRYASATAAAYAKELLAYVPGADVQETKRASEILQLVDQKLDNIQQSSRSVHAKVESIISGDRSQRLRQWLAAPDPNTNANHARELRHEGSGTWLLETSTFQEWMSGTHRHLWLRGMAGCGKTVLSTTVLDHLSKTDDRTILSFFFDFSDATKQTKDSLLRSMALQLYQQGCSSVATHLDDSFRAHQEGGLNPTTSNLEELVDKLLTAQKSVVIVLDALDESTTRDAIISWIKRIHGNLSFVQMLYTSREEIEFMNVFPSTMGRECCLSIDKEATDMDIASYVSARLQAQADFTRKRLSGDVLERVRNKVGNGAKGMFRWAACQLDSLAKSPSLDELEEQLDSLPLDLPDTYCRMLDSIPDGYRERTMRLLQFLVFSKKSLTLKEGVEIFATEIQGEQPCFKPGRRLFNPNDILRHCNSLVSLVDVERYRGTVQELHLSHFSVQEYLLVHVPIFNEMDANIAITKTLMTYLRDIRGRLWELEHVFPLASYAASAWTNFAVVAEASEDILATIVSFLQQEKTFQRWKYLTDSRGSYFYEACAAGLNAVVTSIIDSGIDIDEEQNTFRFRENPLEAASRCGHMEVVRLLIAAEADVNANRRFHGTGTALQLACAGGHAEIAQLLIEHGARINAEGGAYGTALQRACAGGHTEIAQLLIEHGARIDAEKCANGTALQAACYRGHLDIVRLLIKHNARVHVQTKNGRYRSALAAASAGGRIRVVELLLSLQVDINAGNALMHACKGGHLDVVQLLIKKGADVNAGNALVFACKFGHLDIVQLLLDIGAGVNAQGELMDPFSHEHLEVVQLLLRNTADLLNQLWCDGGPLMAACKSVYDRDDVVQLLLDHGVDIQVEGGCYGNPLQAAAYHHNRNTVALLLDRGADVNARGGKYGSALQAACAEGPDDIEVVRLLIDHGADLNIQGGQWGSPLRAAYFKGKEGIFYFLTASGADITAENTNNMETFLHITNNVGSMRHFRMITSLGKDLNCSTATLNKLLQTACYYGDKESIEALVKLGAEIEAQGDRYGSALHAACANTGQDRQDIVHLLIELGAGVNTLGRKSTTAVHKASQAGNKKVVSLLLAYGAETEMMNDSGMTPLHKASSNGHAEIVTVLLRNGSNIEAKENRGLTPLHLASFKGHEEVVKLLIDGGSIAESTNNDGQTPLHLASWSLDGYEGVVELLLREGCNPGSTDNYGQTPLHLASWKGHGEVAELLIKHGANLDSIDDEGRTPLHIASLKGYEMVAKRLLKYGVNMELADHDGRTPLYLATWEGHRKVSKLLIKNGANAEGRWKSLALDSFHDHHRLVELLLENGTYNQSTQTEGRPNCPP